MKNINKVLVLVVAHKDFDDSNLPECYKVIKVGSSLSPEVVSLKHWLTDDSGDNIAESNPYYCELTAHYWAWKNIKDVDYIGISHYRRYFMDYKWNARTFKENILSASKIIRIFQSSYRAIMPFWEKKVGNWLYLDETRPYIRQNDDFAILREIIRCKFPNVLNSFDKITRGDILTYANMVILSKTDFDEYSSFLFDILKSFDNIIKERNHKLTLRCDGYLSEILLPVWTSYKFNESQIFRTDIMNSEQNGWTRKTLIGHLRVFHPILCLVRKMQLVIRLK